MCGWRVGILARNAFTGYGRLFVILLFVLAGVLFCVVSGIVGLIVESGMSVCGVEWW